MAAASCDGGDRENNVDSSLVGGVGGANACHYVVYCRTVRHPLAHRYEQVREPTRHGIRMKQTDGGRPPIGHDQQHSRNPTTSRRRRHMTICSRLQPENSTKRDAWHAVLSQSAQSAQSKQ